VDDLLAELTGSGPAQPASRPAPAQAAPTYTPTPVKVTVNDGTDELDNVMNALQGMNTSAAPNKSFAPSVSFSQPPRLPALF